MSVFLSMKSLSKNLRLHFKYLYYIECYKALNNKLASLDNNGRLLGLTDGCVWMLNGMGTDAN